MLDLSESGLDDCYLLEYGKNLSFEKGNPGRISKYGALVPREGLK